MKPKKSQSEISTVKYYFKEPVTENLKRQVIKRFKTISPETLLGLALYNYSLKGTGETNAEFSNLLHELSMQIKDEPLIMKRILGTSFHYFEDLLT